MTSSRTLLFAAVLGVSVALFGVLLTWGDDSDSPPAHAQGDTQGIVPAGDPPCDLIPDVLVDLAFAIISGDEHEEFILLGELFDLIIDCIIGGLAESGALSSGQTASVHIEGSPGSNFVPVDGTFDGSTRMIVADGVGTVAGLPNVTVELEMHISETGVITGQYTMGANNELPGGNPAIYQITGTVPTPTPSPSPSPSPEPTGEPTPTESPGPGIEEIWANADCSEDGVTTRDNQATLRHVLEQDALGQTEPCTDLGMPIQVQMLTAAGAIPAGGVLSLIWGDVDCDFDITSRDNQAILRFVLEQNPLGQTEPCPDVGARVIVIEGGGKRSTSFRHAAPVGACAQTVPRQPCALPPTGGRP